MPAFDFTPVASALEEIGTASATLADQLSRVEMVLEPTSGAVKIDEAQLRTVVEGSVPKDSAQAFIESLIESTRGGMAVFGPPDDPDQGWAMPWLVMEQMVAAWQGMPSLLSRDLGLLGARDADEAAVLVRRSYPHVPYNVFVGKTAGLLVQPPNPIVFPSEHGLGLAELPLSGSIRSPRLFSLQEPSISATGTDGQITTVDPRQALDVARCVLRGSWSGWWGGWSGWLPGRKVCLDHDCADRLANLLMSFDGGKKLLQAVYLALQEGIKTAAKWIVTSAATVLAIIAFLFGVNIKAVNGPRGACLWANWPYTGGLVFWATRR